MAKSKVHEWPKTGPATKAEAAEFLKVSIRTLENWRDAGVLLPVTQPSEELSRFIRYEWETLHLFVRGKVAPAASSK